MGLMRRFLGAASRYDRRLPYTYEARIDVLAGRGREPLWSYYYADTVCGLIEYLDANGIEPRDVELVGIFRGREIPLEITYCMTRDGHWLTPPALCRALEFRYRMTMEDRYRGHTAEEPCAFDDRDRRGCGPY